MNNTLDVRMQHAVEHDETIEGVLIQKPASSSIPKNGEIVFNRTRTNFKVGDGNTAYTNLTNIIPAVPTKTSDLTNDSGFITDAGVTSFNGSTGAITYNAPVTSVNNETGAVIIPAITSMTSTTSGFIVVYTDSNGNTTTYTIKNGQDGTSVTIKGSLNSTADLANVSNPSLGDGYIIDGYLWVYTGTTTTDTTHISGFENVGQIRGPKGDKGDAGETGPQGPIGPQGETGPAGQNGQDGQDGQDGADGTAATVTVGTTTTGAAGTNASVTNSGTVSAAVFDFVIPRGANGVNGTDGNSVYIAYADDEEGGGFSTEYLGQMYIGTYIGIEQSDDPSVYTWAKFIGDDGRDGQDGQDLTEKPVYTYTGSGTASCNDIITNSFGAGNPISNYSGIIINYSQVSGTETTSQKIVQFNPDNRLNGLNIGQKFTIIIKGYSTANALMQLGMKINFSSSYDATGTVTISMDGSTLYFEKTGNYNYYYDSTHIYYTCLVLSFTKIGTNSFILE